MGLFRSIASILAAIWSFLFNAFTHYDQVAADAEDIAATVRRIITNIQAERDAIKRFKFSPHWKSRVISAPRVVENLQDLKGAVFDDLHDRLEKIYAPVHEFALIFKTEAIESGDPQQAVSALSKAEVKLGHVVTMIHQVRDALHEIEDLTALFDRLRVDTESLDELFLPQTNPRKRVSGFKLRVGALHDNLS